MERLPFGCASKPVFNNFLSIIGVNYRNVAATDNTSIGKAKYFVEFRISKGTLSIWLCYKQTYRKMLQHSVGANWKIVD